MGTSLRRARIDVEAIRRNVLRLTELASTPIMISVAANGFGHGALPATRAAVAGGAEGIAVSFIEDAVELREAGITVPLAYRFGGRGTETTSLSADLDLIPLDDALGGSDLVLVEEGAYGVGSFKGRSVAELGLRAAMRVSAGVVGTKSITEGEGVSYGYTYRASRRTNLALVALGYADGVDRIASNVGHVLLNGAMRRIAGRVAMDVIVLELGDDEASVGDEAVLFGDSADGEPTADDWAAAIGSTSGEVVSAIGARVARSYS